MDHTEDLQLNVLAAAVLAAEEAHSHLVVEHPDHGPHFTRARAVAAAVRNAEGQWRLGVAAEAATAIANGHQMTEDQWQYVAAEVAAYIEKETAGNMYRFLEHGLAMNPQIRPDEAELERAEERS